MPRSIGFFDVDKVQCGIAGRLVLGGWAKGEFLNVTYQEDAFTLVTGAGGDATRNARKNNTARLKLRLLHTSTFNQYLWALLKADKLSGRGGFPVTVVDIMNQEVHTSPIMWIMKEPDSPFSTDEIVREWNFETHDMDSQRLPLQF